jgi:hypothetical protein
MKRISSIDARFEKGIASIMRFGQASEKAWQALIDEKATSGTALLSAWDQAEDGSPAKARAADKYNDFGRSWAGRMSTWLREDWELHERAVAVCRQMLRAWGALSADSRVRLMKLYMYLVAYADGVEQASADAEHEKEIMKEVPPQLQETATAIGKVADLHIERATHFRSVITEVTKEVKDVVKAV